MEHAILNIQLNGKRPHADGMWFSSWEIPCSCFRLDKDKNITLGRTFHSTQRLKKKNRFNDSTFSLLVSSLCASCSLHLQILSGPKSLPSQNIYELEHCYFALASECQQWMQQKPNYSAIFADSSIKIHLSRGYWLTIGRLAKAKEQELSLIFKAQTVLYNL